MLRDAMGVVLILTAVGGVMVGVRGATSGAWWGVPSIAAGAAANVVAYRLMRPTKRAEEAVERTDPPA